MMAERKEKPLPKFKGLWLPAALLADKRISHVEKSILADIRHLSGPYNFSYTALAKKFGVGRMTIIRAVERLSGKLGMIKSGGKTKNRGLILTESAELLFDETPMQTPEKQKPFVKPTALQVVEYAASIDYEIDGQKFIDHYKSKGWKVGKSPMKDWRAAIRTWKLRNKDYGKTNAVSQSVRATPYIR